MGDRRNSRHEQEGNFPNPHKTSPIDEQVSRDIAGSPAGSLASRSSSTRRENRIVELLHENESNDNSRREDNWMIGADFYEEDVAADLDQQSSDDEYGIESEMDDDLVGQDSGSDYDDENFEDIIDDFIVAPEIADESSNDESDNDDADGTGRGNVANYDTTLPAVHRYLGENFEELRGMRIFSEGHITSLPLFNLKHVVLLPGQILPFPLSNSNYRVSAQFKACISNSPDIKPLVGLMSEPRKNIIGTTAEIQSYSDQAGELTVILEGRQRFRLISQPFEITIMGTVKILPEISLGRPFPRIPSWQKFMTKPTTAKRFIVSKHPHWILRSHEAASMVSRIVEQIKNWCSGVPKQDAADFSYWVAANLPINNNERMKALTFDCIETRLSWLLSMLEKSEFFGCSYCKNVICHKREVFLMSCLGPQNSFVNSHGFIHDTLTVRSTIGLIHEGEWSSECSWFPGYSWRIALCENCRRHIGWCYKTTEPNIIPRRFFGLSRANVRLQSSGLPPEQVIPPYIVEM